MKTKLVAAVSAGVAAVAAVTLIAGMATGAVAALPPVPTPTMPYPAVPANPNPKVCAEDAAAVKAAQDAYNAALAIYNSDLRLFYKEGGPYASAKDVLNARTAVDEAVIALIKARYAQATCWNDATKPQNNCVNLNLALNRLLDELPATKDIQANAQRLLQMAQKLPKGYVTPTELSALKKAVAQAAAATAALVAQIAAQKKEVIKANCAIDERPPPAPTKSPSPTPSTSGSPTSAPTTSPSPSRSTSTPVAS